jgi:hypothetical protein
MKDQNAFAETASRRNFLLGVAAVAALPTLPAVSLAQASATPSPAPGSPEALEIDALMTIVNLRFGSYLKSEEVPLVRRSIERQYASVDTLRKVPIHNDDMPDLLFIPDGR